MLMLALTRSLPNRRHRFKPAGSSRGFSITELLVVIGIIVLLAGLLLVALGKARSRALETTTLSTMQAFARACDTFQGDHGFYPGVIPERVLAQDPKITSTQNALLHLLGGYRVLSPIEVDAGSGTAFDEFEQFQDDSTAGIVLDFEDDDGRVWRIIVDLDRIGEGPFINNRPYAPYFSVSGNELQALPELWVGEPFASEIDSDAFQQLPHLLDAWGQPIIYLRQVRTTGPLFRDLDNPERRPQFLLGGEVHYVNSRQLGSLGKTQPYAQSPSSPPGNEPPLASPNGSILSYGSESELEIDDIYLNWAQLIRHPAFGPRQVENDTLSELTARGAYVLISAGSDGVFFSATDGAGRPGNPVIRISEDDGDFQTIPTIVSEYDDIVVFGGG
ncbi:MAG: hypothetical protein EA377_11470 [Phycisphaerales bacterium]|nr:MAG: hypothetical protein EA377_11470 [Phycisphaerales bacterium]